MKEVFSLKYVPRVSFNTHSNYLTKKATSKTRSYKTKSQDAPKSEGSLEKTAKDSQTKQHQQVNSGERIYLLHERREARRQNNHSHEKSHRSSRNVGKDPSKDEARREYQRRYYRVHREKALEYQRQYNLTHKRKNLGRGNFIAPREAIKKTYNIDDIQKLSPEKASKVLSQILGGERFFTLSIGKNKSPTDDSRRNFPASHPLRITNTPY